VPDLPIAEPAQARVDTMATKGSRLLGSLEQLTTRLEPCPNHKPISDIELVERYCSIHIRDKLARTGMMREPNLRHLVALYNLYDAIAFGEHKQNHERIRAHHENIYRVWPSRTSSCYKEEYRKTVDELSSATTQCDESLHGLLDNLHFNL
jgi:hypothetical protein